MDNRIIAVTGATGQQGRAVARRLLTEGWKVRALTRDASKPAATELAAAGAEIVAGDMDSRAELDAAFKGVYGVFSVQNYWLPNVGFDGEVRQGKSVAAAAKAAGVQHFVYTSVGAAHRGMGQKHFESKWLIEQYIHSLDMPYSILRPAGFMDNYNWSRPYILNGTLQSLGMRSDKKIQMIAAEDIGAFVAYIFAKREKYLAQTIEFASDEATEAEVAAMFTKVIGRPVNVVPARQDQAPSEEMVAMLKFFNGEGYTADIPALRKVYPGLLTLEQYLRRNGWENAEQVPLPTTQEQWG
jgi:uncharacterized protein YbjT (DUF2867 family)